MAWQHKTGRVGTTAPAVLPQVHVGWSPPLPFLPCPSTWILNKQEEKQKRVRRVEPKDQFGKKPYAHTACEHFSIEKANASAGLFPCHICQARALHPFIASVPLCTPFACCGGAKRPSDDCSTSLPCRTARHLAKPGLLHEPSNSCRSQAAFKNHTKGLCYCVIKIQRRFPKQVHNCVLDSGRCLCSSCSLAQLNKTPCTRGHIPIWLEEVPINTDSFRSCSKVYEEPQKTKYWVQKR